MTGLQDDKRLNVMIVEDDKLQSLGLEHALAEMGHKVVATAHTMTQAMQALDRIGLVVDVVLLDVSLGGELTTALASRLDDCRIRYIAVTGFRPRDLPDLGFVCTVLEKPYSDEDLAACLRMAVEVDAPQRRSDTSFSSAGCKPA